jgi:hypothetical protein
MNEKMNANFEVGDQKEAGYCILCTKTFTWQNNLGCWIAAWKNSELVISSHLAMGE